MGVTSLHPVPWVVETEPSLFGRHDWKGFFVFPTSPRISGSIKTLGDKEVKTRRKGFQGQTLGSVYDNRIHESPLGI